MAMTSQTGGAKYLWPAGAQETEGKRLLGRLASLGNAKAGVAPSWWPGAIISIAATSKATSVAKFGRCPCSPRPREAVPAPLAGQPVAPGSPRTSLSASRRFGNAGSDLLTCCLSAWAETKAPSASIVRLPQHRSTIIGVQELSSALQVLAQLHVFEQQVRPLGRGNPELV